MSLAETVTSRPRVRPATLAWLLLVALSLVTFVADRITAGRTALVVVLMAIAALKGALVADHFMGLLGVRWRWRGLLYGYLITLATVLALIFVAA